MVFKKWFQFNISALSNGRQDLEVLLCLLFAYTLFFVVCFWQREADRRYLSLKVSLLNTSCVD